jgi:hypothetical protein
LKQWWQQESNLSPVQQLHRFVEMDAYTWGITCEQIKTWIRVHPVGRDTIAIFVMV